MPRVAVIADTHVSSRARQIPEWVVSEVENADHTIHAGDFDSAEALDTVRDLAGEELTVVSGNMDRRLDLPDMATIERGGVEFVVTHGHGDIASHEDIATLVNEHSEDAVGVSGHTHQVFDEVVDGVHLLNPGSATGANPATAESMMVLTVENGDFEVTLHER